MKDATVFATVALSLILVCCRKPVERVPPPNDDTVGFLSSDTPAEGAEVRPGDEILEIDGVSVGGSDGGLDPITERIVFSKGDSIGLHNGESIELVVQSLGLEALVSAVRCAIEAHDRNALAELSHTEGQLNEYTEANKRSLKIVENETLGLEAIRSERVGDHKPEMNLPGELHGKRLEYIRKPSHWIVASLSSRSEGRPSVSFELTFPAARFDDGWKIVGTRYKP